MSSLDIEEIRRVTDAIIVEVTKHPSWNNASRLRWVSNNFASFQGTFPHLVNMCIGVQSFTDAKNVRSMLDLMLMEMQQVDSKSKDFEQASIEVGRGLGARYITPTLEKNGRPE